MTLYFIGLGLNNEKDITINGLEALRKCSVVYLEYYTSILNCSKDKLEEVYGKKIIVANRQMVESDENGIINAAKDADVAFLVAGDPLVATTHMDLYLRARQHRIKCKIYHNASVVSAIGITGLQVYKFGKVTSIPMHNENVETPYNVLKENQSIGLHTLFLLDLNPDEGKFMTANDAIRYLLKVEIKRNEKIFLEKTLCVGCARIGSDDQLIKFGHAKDILKVDFGKPVHCLIVPGKMHFMEEESLKIWS
jgi:diphthine synthase